MFWGGFAAGGTGVRLCRTRAGGRRPPAPPARELSSLDLPLFFMRPCQLVRAADVYEGKGTPSPCTTLGCIRKVPKNPLELSPLPFLDTLSPGNEFPESSAFFSMWPYQLVRALREHCAWFCTAAAYTKTGGRRPPALPARELSSLDLSLFTRS